MSELNFATLDIEYVHTPTSILISTITNNPCHLWLYHTDKQPLKHPTTRTIRGLRVPWSTYFCFVGWQAVEQREPADTLFHSFEVTPWSFCQTKYFTLRGTVAGIDSPSCSPIFKHHHDGLTDTMQTWPITTWDRDLTGIPNHVWACPDACPTALAGGYTYHDRHHWGTALNYIVGRIPRLATITEAYLIFTAWGTNTGTCRYTRIRAELTPNPATFAGETWPSIRARWHNSTVFVNYDNIEPWYQELEYNSVNISPVIQELVNQPWWSPPRPVVLFWDDWDWRTPFLPYDVRRAYSFHTAMNKTVQLRVKWQY